MSDRVLAGPNATRAWLNLSVPEPGATLGSLAALTALVLCHRARRRDPSPRVW